MGVKAQWDNDKKTIIREIFIDPWTIDEHRDSMLKIGEMLESQPHTVHVIVDMRKTTFAPGQLMLNSRIAESVQRSNSGLILLLDPPTFVQTIIRASKRFMPRVASHLHLVNTLQEAYDLIAATEKKADTVTLLVT